MFFKAEALFVIFGAIDKKKKKKESIITCHGVI